MESKCNNAILKDICRTFPENKYFQSDEERNTKGIGYVQLYNILKAISNHFPNMGYT